MRHESSQIDPERVCPECGGRKSARAKRCHKCVKAELDRLAGRLVERHWRVRIVLRGGALWPISRTEPVLNYAADGSVTGVDADWLTGPGFGDVIAYIDWSEVRAVGWREYAAR